MKRILALALTLLLCLAPIAHAAPVENIDEWVKAQAALLSDDQKQINLMTWTYYVPDEVVADFEALTGITINYAATMGDNEEMISKLVATPDAYDMLVISDIFVMEMAQLGMLEELDRTKIPNFSNINPTYQGQFFDPDNKYSIAYTHYVPLLCYNPDMVEAPVEGYADLWRDEFKGKLAVLADIRNVIGMAQKKLGYSYNDTDPEHMALVAKELETLKPNIVVFNSDTPHNALISGEATAGFMFGSQIVYAQEMGTNLVAVYPQEGLGFGIDDIVMSAQAQNKDAAYIFMNYLLDGKVSAYASDLIDYGNCNTAATEFLSEDFVKNMAINVPQDLLAEAEMMVPLTGDDLTLYNDIWVNFRQ